MSRALLHRVLALRKGAVDQLTASLLPAHQELARIMLARLDKEEAMRLTTDHDLANTDCPHCLKAPCICHDLTDAEFNAHTARRCAAIIQGGQSRTADDVRDSAGAIVLFLGICLGAALGAGITALVLS